MTVETAELTDLAPSEAAQVLLRTADEVWLAELQRSLDRQRARAGFDRVLAVWNLNQSEAAALFGVTRQAIAKWRDRGVPAGRVEAVADLSAATDLLVRHLKRDRIPAVVRRGSAQLGGQSLLDLVDQGRTRDVLLACRAMFRFGDALVQSEVLPDGRIWYRIAEADWIDPLDPSFAAVVGGRWNPPNSHPTLYLNEDRITARLNLRGFIDGWPYDPEDLLDETGPVLAHATLPSQQRVADVHTRQGVAAVNLPSTYPVDAGGRIVEHAVCQPIGLEAKEVGLRGVRARSARAPEGGGRELAWFPATPRSHARAHLVQSFETWYWD